MTREIRILHTADTHLGYRQYHSEVRRQDFFNAFSNVVNDALEMQVDAVVHAGDFFDSRNPTLEDLLDAINIISRLKAAGIPFLAIVGNHESKQNTQWLDLFEEMGVACRLGKKPCMVGEAAIYGIDSVPKSKIPIFDYSDFEVPENLPEDGKNLLVMHQIMQPFPYGEWSCEEVLENLPFKVDAVLMGDYHKYEKIKVGDTWVTYPGSTERNSASESEPRSYNIITLSGAGLEITRRTIPTRDFLFISVNLKEEEKPYEQIFAAVDEYQETLPESVVFLEISGDPTGVLSFKDIEEYLLNKGALVPRVRDQRVKDAITEEVLKVSFSDPDHAVAEEIKRISLTDGGLIVDEIVRNPNVVRSRVDEETENRLVELISAIDFKDPAFKIEMPAPESVPGSVEETEKGDSEKAEVPEIESEFGYPENTETLEDSEIAEEPEPVELPEALEVPEPAVPSEPALPSEQVMLYDEAVVSKVNTGPESVDIPEPVEAPELAGSSEPVENSEEPEVSVEPEESKVSVGAEVPEESEVSVEPEVPEKSEVSVESEVPDESKVAVESEVPEESEVAVEPEVSEKVDVPDVPENVPTEKEINLPEKEEQDEGTVFWKPPASSGVSTASSELPSRDGAGEEKSFTAFESSKSKSKETSGRGLDSFMVGEAEAKGGPDSGDKGDLNGKLPEQESEKMQEQSTEAADKSAKPEKEKEKSKGKGKSSALRQYNLGDYL
jgi:exonuclease SbcD